MSTPISLGIYVLDTKGFRNPTSHEVYDLVKHSDPPSISYDPAGGGEFFAEEEYDEEADETYWTVYSVGSEDSVSGRIEDDEEAHELCATMNLEHDFQREGWEQDDFIANGFTWHGIEADLLAWSQRIHFDVMADVRYEDDGSLARLYISGGVARWTSPELTWPEVPGFPSFDSEE